jgi:hypothetical protein
MVTRSKMGGCAHLWPVFVPNARMHVRNVVPDVSDRLVEQAVAGTCLRSSLRVEQGRNILFCLANRIACILVQ